ncbi:MAG TPA: glycosyltransferase family 4 protein [Gemmatimonadaceae bacterium]|nr:glycosyltransferase family 4 protein [Gemmatimonadaceae bacterium]
MRALFMHCAKEWSGTARAFAVAARGLAARGYNVTYLAEPDSNVQQSASRIAAVASKLGGGDPAAHREVAPFEVVPFTCDGFWFACAWSLRHMFRRWDVDVIFVTNDREHLIAATACWLGRHGGIVRRTPAGTQLMVGPHGKVASWLTRTTYLFASEADARVTAQPGKPSRGAVAVLGVDVSRYPDRLAKKTGDGVESDGLRYIICVYDPTSRGRAATAIRTVSMLAPRHPYLRLIIFGAGSDSEDLRMQAAALDVIHLVSFLGERDDHLSLMRDAELGWVVAEADTAAYGILDLMALGVPVIASDGSVANTYVANLISGALVPPEDAAGTAATVVTLLTAEEQRAAMGAAARTRVAREFPEGAMIDGFESAIGMAAGRTRGKG